MIDLADLRLIQAIANAPSLAAAARVLNVTPPATSQRLAQLEADLKLKLVERGAGALHLTAEGEMMARRAEAIISELSQLAGDLSERRGSISGPLSVIAPFGFGRLHIAPLLAAFGLANPEVTVELVLTEDPRGAMRSGSWDLSIIVGKLPDLDVLHRKLAMTQKFLCASPQYLETHGQPLHPLDLKSHRCGVVREDQADVSLWSFEDVKGRKETLRVKPAFSSNDGEVVRSWAVAGMGIIERFDWSVADDLESGRIVCVLPKWKLADGEIVALINPRSLRAGRVEAFLNAAVDKFARWDHRNVL